MPKLPRTRQNRLNSGRRDKQTADRRSLAHAFRTFTQAAGSLEKSYAQLQGEVARLSAELERANSELSLKVEENVRVRGFLTRVLEGLPCGVVVTDSFRRARMMNPEARRLLQLDAAWSPGDDAVCPATLSALLSAATLSGFSCEQEWVFNSAGGNRTLGISGSHAETSCKGETIWIIRDISDQKRLAAAREAARRARALAEIATVLAHEIRNPLASMELFAGLIADATVTAPDVQEWITQLQAGLRLLAATVNNVLHFHGEPSGEMIATNLAQLLRETASFLGPLARQRAIEIVIQNAFEPAVVLADAQRLRQVFFNLTLNAFGAMKLGGTLTIGACPSVGAAKGVQIDFKDEGVGIEREAIQQIFEPGFTTKAGSPGLGLSVCRKVIEQHGGNIAVQSVPGQGSTFSIFLPVAEELHESSACGR
jgi:two-component system, sensor histidine kinase FlrB